MTANPDAPPGLHPADVFEAISDVIPDAPALVWRDVTRTWREFDDRAARLAAAFSAAGLRPGSAVVLYLHNSPAYLEAHFAALKMRGVPVNGNYRYLAEELLYLIENSDAEAIIFDEILAPRLATLAGRVDQLKLLVEVGSSGVAANSVSFETLIARHAPMARITRDSGDRQLTYTGGTTGLPKGVMRALGPYMRGIVGMAAQALDTAPPETAEEAAAQALDRYRAGRSPVSVVAPPLMHGTGMSFGAQVPLIAGGKVVMLDSWSFDPAHMLQLIERHQATSVTIAGDVIGRPLVNELDAAVSAGKSYDLSSVETFYSSGMIWTEEVKRALLRHCPAAQLLDLVGSSEGGIGVSRATLDHVPETGVFTPNTTTKVITTDGREVSPGSGEAGLIAVSGGTVGVGYHKDPEKSAKTYRTIAGTSYAIAGDWATVDADGSIRFLGRGTSCINTGGEKVFAEEVEKAILSLPEVADCLVLGMPDQRWGQAVAAIVAPLPGGAVSVEAVQQAVRAQLAGYKVPRRVLITENPPRAPNGKPDFDRARALLQAAVQGAETYSQ